jgi:hypothetical protein
MYGDKMKGEIEIRLNPGSPKRETVASVKPGLISCVKHVNQSESRART